MTEETHKLGEVLRTAREARGVDLARVERDTKIRSRYLSALERGEYRELPGAVYTKGFLRNYALYLGLDPEYLTDLYRIETAGARVERPSPAPPRPIRLRRARALVVTPGAIGAAVLTVAVLALVGYFVYEFVTFAHTPGLSITNPVGDVASYHEMSYTITGKTEPNSTITVSGLRENPTATADGQGNFSVTVRLVPGANVIRIVASDPVTQRDSDEVRRTINVDLGPSPTPGVPLAVIAPAEGATLNGPVKVSGTASAGAQVAISARLVAPLAPKFTVTTSGGVKIAVPRPAAGQVVGARATAGTDGAFSATLSLPAGSWQLTVSTGAASASPTSSASPGASGSATPTAGSVTRRVTVAAAAGLAGTLEIKGGASYILLLEDNVPLAGISGRVIQPGKRVALSAKRTIVVRAGNAGAVILTINGVRLPSMGANGAVVEWRIQVSA